MLTNPIQAWRVAALCLFSIAATAAPAPVRSVQAPEVRLLRTPDGGVQPEAALDAQGTLHLVFLKGDPAACDVFYARLPRGQTGFASAQRVNQLKGSAIAIGTIRGAQLALGPTGRIHVLWNGAAADPNATNSSAPLYYTRLNDRGDAFEPERNLIGRTRALDGGGTVAADAKGNVFVIWHALPATGFASETNRAVFLARSRDEGRTFAGEVAVSPPGSGACGCCGLTAFVDAGDRLGILYRAARQGTERDVTLLTSTDSGLTFAPLTVGPWHLLTCPMSSMTLAQGADNTWNAAWETAGQVQVGTMPLAERTCGIAEPEGQASRKHPVIVNSKGSAPAHQLVVWVEGTSWGKGGVLAWEMLNPATGRKTHGKALGVPAWSKATAVATPDGGFCIVY